jgi:ABC-2 type transport system ATP-binding protein
MIQVERLTKYFNRHPAVRDISFTAKKGEVLGFLGPNGAGKSTTMRMITGFIPPTAGRVVVNGHDVTLDPVAARRSLGYLPENAPAYEDMTVEEFLDFIAEVRGFDGAERRGRVQSVIERCLLMPVRRQTIATLSKGYRQRTCFAQAILHDPPALVMDEPTEGLDPNQKHVVRQMIRRMGRDKVIILSTHILEEVEAICTRAIIISDGRIVADGSPAELKRSSEGRERTLDEVFRTLTQTADVAQAIGEEGSS